jgi:hypothetical protein
MLLSFTEMARALVPVVVMLPELAMMFDSPPALMPRELLPADELPEVVIVPVFVIVLDEKGTNAVSRHRGDRPGIDDRIILKGVDTAGDAGCRAAGCIDDAGVDDSVVVGSLHTKGAGTRSVYDAGFVVEKEIADFRVVFQPCAEHTYGRVTGGGDGPGIGNRAIEIDIDSCTHQAGG